jgi:Family of unknown function (DUF5946)
MSSEQEAYDELCIYTLTHGDPTFIHQYVVDAFAVQYSDEHTKPIKLTFGLIGLYLKIEKQFSGKRVQRAHMDLGKTKHVWPAFDIPDDRGSMTPSDVIAAPAGPERDKAIDAWCESVWKPWQANHGTIAELLERHRIVPL